MTSDAYISNYRTHSKKRSILLLHNFGVQNQLSLITNSSAYTLLKSDNFGSSTLLVSHYISLIIKRIARELGTSHDRIMIDITYYFRLTQCTTKWFLGFFQMLNILSMLSTSLSDRTFLMHRFCCFTENLWIVLCLWKQLFSKILFAKLCEISLI